MVEDMNYDPQIHFELSGPSSKIGGVTLGAL